MHLHPFQGLKSFGMDLVMQATQQKEASEHTRGGIIYFIFVMHSWSVPLNYEHDVISPIVKSDLPRMHNKNEESNCVIRFAYVYGTQFANHSKRFKSLKYMQVETYSIS